MCSRFRKTAASFIGNVHSRAQPHLPRQTRADAVCINRKQMLPVTPAVVFPCSIPGGNQVKKNICVLSFKLLLSSLQSHTDKLPPQISSPVLSFARIFFFFGECPHLVCSAGGFWYPFLDPFCLPAQNLSKVSICRGPKMPLSFRNPASGEYIMYSNLTP